MFFDNLTCRCRFDNNRNLHLNVFQIKAYISLIFKYDFIFIISRKLKRKKKNRILLDISEELDPLQSHCVSSKPILSRHSEHHVSFISSKFCRPCYDCQGLIQSTAVLHFVDREPSRSIIRNFDFPRLKVHAVLLSRVRLQRIVCYVHFVRLEIKQYI